MNQQIRVAIVEDNPQILSGLQRDLLQYEDFIIAGTASTKEEAVRIVLNTDVDVVLMDLELKESQIDGLIASQEILLQKDVKIIVVTGYSSEETAQSTLLAGAVACFNKSNLKGLPEVILATVRNPSTFETLLPRLRRVLKEMHLTELSPKEREVFMLFDAGYRHEQIMDILAISCSTLKNHIHEILQILGAKNMGDALAKFNRSLLKVSKEREEVKKGLFARFGRTMN